MDEKIYEEAEVNGLEIIETTTGMNGYPQALKDAVTGFSNYQEAKDFADKFGLRVEFFKRRDGQQLWSRNNNTAYEELDVTAAFDDDMYRLFFSRQDEEEFLQQEVLPELSECTSFDEIQTVLSVQQSIFEEVSDLEEDSFVVVKNYVYYGTYEKFAMRYHDDDVTEYIIGVI